MAAWIVGALYAAVLLCLTWTAWLFIAHRELLRSGQAVPVRLSLAGLATCILLAAAMLARAVLEGAEFPSDASPLKPVVAVLTALAWVFAIWLHRSGGRNSSVGSERDAEDVTTPPTRNA